MINILGPAGTALRVGRCDSSTRGLLYPRSSGIEYHLENQFQASASFELGLLGAGEMRCLKF